MDPALYMLLNRLPGDHPCLPSIQGSGNHQNDQQRVKAEQELLIVTHEHQSSMFLHA